MGLQKLDQYAAAVQSAERPDEISEAQRDAARWIGQLIETLSRCADSQKQHDLIAAHQVFLLDTFSDELSDAVEAGREVIREREFALEQSAGVAHQLADREKERRRTDKVARIEKNLEGADKAKEDAKQSAEEWKEWLDENLAKFDKQLGLLERDYNFLEQRAQSLNQSIMLIGREITPLNLGLSMTDPVRNSESPGHARMHCSNCSSGRTRCSVTNWTTTRRSPASSRSSQQGAQAMQDRAEIIRRYEKATGDLVKKNGDLEKWTDRLKNEKQKLTVQKPAAKGGKKGLADKKQPPP